MPNPPACSTRLNALSARSMVRSTSPSAAADRHTAHTHPRQAPIGDRRPIRSSTWPAPEPTARATGRRRRPTSDATSSRSKVSTSATSSPSRVAAAMSCRASVVRPDDRGPTISDSCPRGMPLRRWASSASSPVGTKAAGSARSSGGKGGGQRAVELVVSKRRFQCGQCYFRHIFGMAN